MKPLLLWILAIPFFANAQTVHVKNGKINYAGTVAVAGVHKPELYERAKKTLLHTVDRQDSSATVTSKVEDEVEANGKMKLAHTADGDNMLLYTVKIKVEEGKYKYHNHKVHVAQLKNGHQVKDLSSKELLEGMEVSGDGSRLAEKQLNEIDMNLQKLIVLIKTAMANAATPISKKGM